MSLTYIASLMNSRRFWIPVAIFFGLTPFMLLIGLMSAGAGEGDYLLAKVLFPYSMLSTAAFHAITRSFFLLAVVQYPLYGLLAGVANLRGKLLICGLALVIVHVATVIASFAFADRYFS
jgi:hypothetical protein